MSTKEELSRRAFEALAKGDDAEVEAIRAEIARLQTRYNNDRDSEVTSIVAQVVRGEARFDDVLPQLIDLVAETVEYGSAAEARLTAEMLREREGAAAVVRELEERLTDVRERGASRASDLEGRLSAEITRRASVASELAAERARSASLVAELAKRPAAATEVEQPSAETAPGSRS